MRQRLTLSLVFNKKRRSWLVWTVLVGSGVTLAGCFSAARYEEDLRQREQKHHQELLAAFPPEKTTRADVQKGLEPSTPDVVLIRVADDWSMNESGFNKPYFQERIAATEQRTRHTVFRCEHYLMPTGLSGGLCVYWFYYDDRERLIDAEWQWHTD
jgi:hypothetical protein